MKRLFDEYEVGTSVSSHGRTITEADIVLHAGQTGDFYPHHMDAEFCATQSFKERIAHGTLILSVAVGMLAGEINEAAMSYGYDGIRFIRPGFHRRHHHSSCSHQRHTGIRKKSRPVWARRRKSRSPQSKR